MTIKLETQNGQQFEFEVWRVVAHEEVDIRNHNVRVHFEGGLQIVLKKTFAEFSDILKAVRNPVAVEALPATTVPGHPVVADEQPTAVERIALEQDEHPRVAATPYNEFPPASADEGDGPGDDGPF